MDLASVAGHGLQVVNLAFVAGIFFRLGAIGTALRDHERRLNTLEERTT